MKKRNKGFTMIPNEILLDTELSASDIRVYLILKYHAMEKDTSYPGINKICQETGLSRSTVLRSTETLKATGYIKKNHRRNNSVVYVLVSGLDRPVSGLDQDGINGTPAGVRNDTLIRTNEEEPIQQEELNKNTEGEASTKVKHPLSVAKSATDPAGIPEHTNLNSTHSASSVEEIIARFGYNPKERYVSFQEWFNRDMRNADAEVWNAL